MSTEVDKHWAVLCVRLAGWFPRVFGTFGLSQPHQHVATSDRSRQRIRRLSPGQRTTAEAAQARA